MSGPATERPDLRVRQFLPPVAVVWEGPQGVVVDFGRQLHGGVRLHGGADPMRVRVTLGESLPECLNGPGGPGRALEAELLLPPHATAEFGETGFRFARIDPLDEGGSLEAGLLEAVSTRREAVRQGSFRCSDELLNRIWDTGAYTAGLCMQGLMWNGLKRERGVSAAALYPAMMTAHAAFGAHPVVAESLDHLRESAPLPDWMSSRPADSLWWVLCHAAWYAQTGDESFLAGQRAYLAPLLQQIRGHIDAGGAESFSGEKVLDATVSEPDAIHAGLQGLTALALRAGAELCHALGETDGQVECQAAANLLRLHSPAPTSNKHANALLALAGLADMTETNERVLQTEPFDGISPASGYTVLQARAMAGDFAGALDLIRAYWGGMLDMGATSFWERFDPAWTNEFGRIDELAPVGKRDLSPQGGDDEPQDMDFCCAGAAGPAAWLTEHVLGVKPVAPGCDAVMVNPNLADLDWAEGALPTPHGAVRVRAEKTADGRTKVDLDAPESVRIVRR